MEDFVPGTDPRNSPVLSIGWVLFLVTYWVGNNFNEQPTNKQQQQQRQRHRTRGISRGIRKIPMSFVAFRLRNVGFQLGPQSSQVS